VGELPGDITVLGQPTPLPKSLFFSTETYTVTGGDSFTTPLRFDTTPEEYVYYDFFIYYDSSLINIDTSMGNNGVSVGTNSFISSVQNNLGEIRVIGRGGPAEGTGEEDNLIFYWTAMYDRSGTSILDLDVGALEDPLGYTIAFAFGEDGSVDVTYNSSPAPTPNPTIVPVTPGPTATPTAPPENLAVDITLPVSASWGGTNHWISNTGDILGPFLIHVTADNFTFDPDADSAYLDILPPLDDNFQVEDEDGNIHENKGDCQFVVYAVDENNENPEILKTFELESDIVTSGDRYREVSSNTGNSLTVGSDGYVYYNGVIGFFGVGILPGTGTVRPGDDFRLRVGLLNYEEFEAAVPPGDFVAVYDKMLLWRANLYIDEGANDWNNLNPWDDPVNNDWYVSQANGADVNGGQISINSFTDIYNRRIDNAVGYSYGCTDTPEFFNYELEIQNESITAKYKANNTEWNAENENPHPDWSPWNGPDTIANNRDDTMAPGNIWNNYLTGIPLNDEDLNYAPLEITLLEGGRNTTYTFHPYTPGFSSRMYVNGLYNYGTHTSYSAGVECQGLIMRAAGYEGNQYHTIYDIPENERMEWGIYVPKNLPGPADWLTRSWEITVYDDEETSVVVPGDIIRIGGHVGIVAKVIYDENRVASTEDITIIEAWGFVMKAHNERTWEAFRLADDENRVCTIRRLIQD
jgi:hypothetical protein